MRIAQVMLARGFGGAERSFVDLSRALAARGHTVLAIGERRGVALGMLDGVAGITTLGIRCHGSWDRLAGHAVRRALAGFAPAVVHTHLARAAHLGGRAAHALGLPTLAKTHNLVDLKYYRAIDCLVPTTQAQADYLAAHGVAASRITRIPNFTAVQAVTTLAAQAEGTPGCLKAIGRFVHKKGFDTLVEAHAVLVREGREVTLELAGDGPERAHLEGRIAALGLGARVRLTGWCDDVAAFLDGGDLFVLPSRDEPFGIVVIEAMARGVPVLATRTQGPLEILPDDCGYLTVADDPAALAAAIAGALDDPDRLARARAALARFHAHYSVEQVVTRYEALYARLAG